MTINSDNIISGPYTGNGATSQFSYTFRVDLKTDLTVFETDDSGNVTELTVDTDYTVNNVGTDGGGTIDRIAGALPVDYQWYIRSNREVTQLTDFDNQGGFFPDVHEKAFDKLTFICLELKDRITRALRLSDSDSSGADLQLPSPVAGKALVWNATEDGIENSDNDVDTVVTAAEAAQTAAEAAQTAAEAAQAGAEAIFDNFDDKYLGAKASAPTLDNDGDPLTMGALYFDTTTNLLNVYDLDTTTWIAIPVTALGSLTDVTLTSIASGELLMWNGSAWVNRTLAELGLALLNGNASEEFAVADDPYDDGWNGNTGAARKDNVYDKIQSLLLPKLIASFDGTNTGTFAPEYQAGEITCTITRDNSGSYTINFSDDFSDTNFVVIPASNAYNTRLQTLSVGSFSLDTSNSSASDVDTDYVSFIVYGELA